jgi:hypothetical protein
MEYGACGIQVMKCECKEFVGFGLFPMTVVPWQVPWQVSHGDEWPAANSVGQHQVAGKLVE